MVLGQGLQLWLKFANDIKNTMKYLISQSEILYFVVPRGVNYFHRKLEKCMLFFISTYINLWNTYSLCAPNDVQLNTQSPSLRPVIVVLIHCGHTLFTHCGEEFLFHWSTSSSKYHLNANTVEDNVFTEVLKANLDHNHNDWLCIFITINHD